MLYIRDNSLLCKGYQGSLCLIRQACETAAKLLLNRQNHILDIHHCKKTEGQVNMIIITLNGRKRRTSKCLANATELL